MVSEIRKSAMEGLYLERSVSLSKLLVTRGNLLTADKKSAVMTPSGLAFSWSTEIEDGKSHYSDQVMLLAFFPELQQIRFETGGAQRYKGKDFLQLDGIKKGFAAEVYISFIANDQESVSNSTYLGQFIW